VVSKIYNFVSKWEFGAPGRIRTTDPQIRSLILYPAELRAQTDFLILVFNLESDIYSFQFKKAYGESLFEKA
jgi:hypothetical protein